MKLFSLLFLIMVTNSVNAALPKGNAAWVYDAKGSTTPAMWSEWIEFYNSNTLYPHNIRTVYSYGGDMGFYSGVPTTSFSVKNQTAAKLYKQVYGVKHVILTIDGQMGEGESYSPDLSRLTVEQVQAWADKTATLYCAYDFVDGVQIDLEPARAPYITNLLVFLKRLSFDLRVGSCITPTHPEGRTVGAFMGAGAATKEMFSALGSNGYVILSGYDLSDAPLGSPPTHPTLYGQQLTSRLKLLAANAGATGSYVIGIPAGASSREFSQYIPLTGSPVMGYPMYSSTQPNYTKEAIQAIKNTVYTNPNYLGTALWGFTLTLTIPYSSKNMFFPPSPFLQAGQMQYLQGNL